MLNERCRELITAYVDGELSARQHAPEAASALLSPEARTLLKRLQADSHELRALPATKLDQDLSDTVLSLIAQRQIQPPRKRVIRPPTAPSMAGAMWPHLAAAAAVLFAVGLTSFLFFIFL